MRRSRTPCSPIPTITGILSLECCSTPAAGTWVERNNTGRQGQGRRLRPARPDGRAGGQDGNIQATIDQAPEKQGFAAVDMLVKFLKGKPIDNLDTGVGVYTKENIAEVAKK